MKQAADAEEAKRKVSEAETAFELTDLQAQLSVALQVIDTQKQAVARAQDETEATRLLLSNATSELTAEREKSLAAKTESAMLTTAMRGQKRQMDTVTEQLATANSQIQSELQSAVWGSGGELVAENVALKKQLETVTTELNSMKSVSASGTAAAQAAVRKAASAKAATAREMAEEAAAFKAATAKDAGNKATAKIMAAKAAAEHAAAKITAAEGADLAQQKAAAEAVAAKLKIDGIKQILLRAKSDLSLSIQDLEEQQQQQGVVADLVNAGEHLKATDLVIEHILALSPGACKPTMLKGRKFDEDGALTEWALDESDITALPESFCALSCRGDLSLSFNELASLPTSFHKLQIEGDIFISRNQLCSLPANLCQLKIGGGLNLRDNQLRSLPSNFHGLKLGGSLDLAGNELHALPDRFAQLKIGGYLALDDNNLRALPDGFGNISVGGDVFLGENPLTEYPTSFPNVKGKVALE